ncbi:hypothetical protein [Azospirillum sp. sgz302134]
MAIPLRCDPAPPKSNAHRRPSISEWLFGAPMGFIVASGLASVPVGTVFCLLGDILAYLQAHAAERRGHWSSRIEDMRIAFRILLAGPLLVIAAMFGGPYVETAIHAVPAALGIIGS